MEISTGILMKSTVEVKCETHTSTYVCLCSSLGVTAEWRKISYSPSVHSNTSFGHDKSSMDTQQEQRIVCEYIFTKRSTQTIHYMI